jgi:general stress protein YciG
VEIFLIKRRTLMAGTKAGGQKAAAKNLQRDPDFYAKIGRKGGINGHTGGFAANPELARIAGAKGGRISRRTKKTVA